MKGFNLNGLPEGKKEKVLNFILEVIIPENSYEEKFSKSYYSKKAGIWEKHRFFRLYIPRNAYENAGYIDLLTGKIKETRPGNYSVLKEVVEEIERKIEEIEKEEEEKVEEKKEEEKEVEEAEEVEEDKK